MASERLFQACGLATAKAQSPSVDLHGQTGRACVLVIEHNGVRLLVALYSAHLLVVIAVLPPNKMCHVTSYSSS